MLVNRSTNIISRRRIAAAVVATLITIVLVPCAVPSQASGGSGPAAVPPLRAGTFADKFGVADSHLPISWPATMDSVLSRAREAGLSWVRCVFAWCDMEPIQGIWNYTLADLAMDKARSYGVKVLGIVGASPSWANGGNDPRYPPTDIAAWQNYLTTVCGRFKDRVSAWEIWNEENIDAFWQPAPNPNSYVALVSQTTPSIRAADPDAKVVMGGVAGLGPDFLYACLNLGIAEYVDAIAYHPYVETIGPPTGNAPKEQLCRLLVTWVRALISEHTTRPLEIWLTELGWTDCIGSPSGVDEDTQASYMLRSLINYADTEASRVFWYDLWDEINDPSNPSYNLGLLRNDFSKRPAYYYYRVFQNVIGQATSSAPSAASCSCSRPGTLEAHCFNLSDGSLAVCAWKSDDAGDSLTLSLAGAAYANPVTVDLATGGERSTAGISRAADGRITVSDLAVGKRPVILRFGPETSAVSWYLAEGTTDWGFDTYISIQNPNPGAASAHVTYMTDTGPVAGPSLTLPGKSQATVFPRDTLGSRDFSTRVATDAGETIAVDRTMTWTGPGAQSQESHSSVGVTDPNKVWYLPEGSSDWGFECWLLIQNPNAGAASCTVTYMIEGASPVTVQKYVPANSRASFNMADDIGPRDASIKVEADVPVIPERAMYRNNRREGHDSIGTTTPSTDFYLAEGTTDWGFTTYVLIQNPGEQQAQVDVTYMTQKGPVQQAPFSMPPRSRKTIKVNDALPGRDLSTRVHANVPIIAERAMYWDNGTGEACHDSIGMSSAHAAFYLPDGQSSSERETWTLVQNPNDIDVQVEVTYMTPTGAGNRTFTDIVGANSRKTFNMAEHSGLNGRAAVMVKSKTAGKRIIVERSMYWNNRGAGTDTIGGFSD